MSKTKDCRIIYSHYQVNDEEEVEVFVRMNKQNAIIFRFELTIPERSFYSANADFRIAQC